MPGRVIDSAGVGARFAAAALIDKHDAVVCWVEEDGVAFCAVAAWAAVEEDNCWKSRWYKFKGIIDRVGSFTYQASRLSSRTAGKKARASRLP